MKTFSEIKSLISEYFPESILGEDLNASPKALLINSKFIHAVCEILHVSEHTYFDMLSCLTGIDNGPERGSMEMVYNLYSIPFDHHLMLKVKLERLSPEIDSVVDIWKTADWHEREAFDLLGITFKNHPDLRRILMPKDWVGHPLRKDYQEPDKYHGMTVVYDRNEESEKWKDESGKQ